MLKLIFKKDPLPVLVRVFLLSPYRRIHGQKPTLQQCLFISFQFINGQDYLFLINSSIRNFPFIPRKVHFLPNFSSTPRKPNNEHKSKWEFETISNKNK